MQQQKSLTHGFLCLFSLALAILAVNVLSVCFGRKITNNLRVWRRRRWRAGKPRRATTPRASHTWLLFQPMCTVCKWALYLTCIQYIYKYLNRWSRRTGRLWLVCFFFLLFFWLFFVDFPMCLDQDSSKSHTNTHTHMHTSGNNCLMFVLFFCFLFCLASRITISRA